MKAISVPCKSPTRMEPKKHLDAGCVLLYNRNRTKLALQSLLGLTNKTIGGIVMKNLTAQAVYTADIYLRLSDDDGDKPESNSIKNQRNLSRNF